MEIKEIIDFAISNGIGCLCIVYFMIRDWKFMDTMQKTLTSLDESTQLIERYFLKQGNGKGKGDDDDLR